MKKIMYAVLASLLASVNASAVTATKEYVDRQDGATLQAAKDYTDAHGGGGGGIDTNAVIEIAGEVVAPVASQVTNLSSSVSSLQSSKADKSEIPDVSGFVPSANPDYPEAYSFGWMNKAGAYWGYNSVYLGFEAETRFNGIMMFGDGFQNVWYIDPGFGIQGSPGTSISGFYNISCYGYGDIMRGSTPVVYGITVNGGEPMHGDVDLTIPVVSPTDPTFSNAVKKVMEIRDETQNLKYTITGDDNRFYFEPIGAINPED